MTRKVLSILLLSFFPAAAFSTTVLELSLDSLGSRSDLIATGRCVSKRVHFNLDKTRIYTDWTVAVESVIKGGAEGQIVIRQFGGEISDIGMKMTGTARFEQGEEVLLFAYKGEEGVMRLVGLGQGKFKIVTDKATGEKYALRDTSGLLLVSDDKGEKTRIPTPVKLSDLIERIKTGISGQEK